MQTKIYKAAFVDHTKKKRPSLENTGLSVFHILTTHHTMVKDHIDYSSYKPSYVEEDLALCHKNTAFVTNKTKEN